MLKKILLEMKGMLNFEEKQNAGKKKGGQLRRQAIEMNGRYLTQDLSDNRVRCN